MAQPPFSQQIRRLEAELGVPLLTHTSRRVALTLAGSQLLEGARDLLSRRTELTDIVQRVAQGDWHPAAFCESLLREPLMLVLPTSHPLAKHAQVPLSALADQPFVLFPRSSSSGLHDTITSMCLSAGFSPQIVQEAGSWSSVVSLVDAGVGITIAPASARALCPATVTFLDLYGAGGEAELVLAYPQRSLSGAAERFIATARQAVGG